MRGKQDFRVQVDEFLEYSIRGLTAFKVLTEQIGFAVQRISSKTTELDRKSVV